VALVIVALVAAGGVGATMLLTSSTGVTSTVVGYAPADSVMYVEARLDLPGNQRAEVAKTLSAFPGFADQSALPSKLNEVLDRIVKDASNSKHDYQTDIAPWFGGQIGIAQGPSSGLSALAGLAGASPAPSPTTNPTAGLPACTGATAPAPTASEAATPAPSGSGVLGEQLLPLGLGKLGMSSLAANARALALANVTDSQKAQAFVNSVIADGGVATSDVTCDGVVVHLVKPNAPAAAAMPDAGWAILADKVLAVGDLDSIRLAIATKGTAGLSSTAAYQSAVAALPGDHIGFVYEALRASIQGQLDSLKAFDTDGTVTALASILEGNVPEWIAGDIKAANGNLQLDSAQPAVAGQTATNRASDLAAAVPPTTIALVDVHDVGKSLEAFRAKAQADPKLAPYVKQVDDALGLAGGFAGALGWIGDAGIAVTNTSSGVSGGIVIRPDDAAAAQQLFTELRTMLGLAGVSAGVSVTDEAYNGATITTVDLSALAPLLQSSMGSSLPAGVTLPKNVKLSYVVTDKIVVLTLDPAFAKAVIDTTKGGPSLASDPRFSALLQQAGSQGTGLTWLDVTGVRTLIEGLLPADAKTKYEADYKPYLLPLDALLSVGSTDGNLQRGTMILGLKH
jgi:hypothetical protein